MSDPPIKRPSIIHLDELFNNPLFAGGVGLAGLGGGARRFPAGDARVRLELRALFAGRDDDAARWVARPVRV